MLITVEDMWNSWKASEGLHTSHQANYFSEKHLTILESFQNHPRQSTLQTHTILPACRSESIMFVELKASSFYHVFNISSMAIFSVSSCTLNHQRHLRLFCLQCIAGQQRKLKFGSPTVWSYLSMLIPSGRMTSVEKLCPGKEAQSQHLYSFQFLD